MAEKAKKNEETVEVKEEGTPAAQTLQTKSAMMSGILASMSSMSHEQMMQWFADAQELAKDISGGAAASNAASVQMKPSAAAAHFGGMKEEVASLFDGQDLAEEVKTRVSVLIENAVNVRTSLIRQELEEEFEAKMVEEAGKMRDELVEKVDQYVTYAAEQWIEKNEVAIESTLKVERAEKLFEGIKKLAVECGLEIPEESVDAVAELTAKVEELEGKVNESIEEAIAYKERFEAVQALRVFDDVSEGLTVTEVEKFKVLIEDIEISEEPEELKKKLEIIRDAHFKTEHKVRAETGITEAQEHAPITEEVKQPTNRYAEYLTRASMRRYGG